jgi:hypothetical protein
MKILKTLVAILVVSASSNVMAQNTTLGITGGYQMSSFDLWDQSENYHGANFGFTGVWSNHEHWGVGGELLYSRSGGSFTQFDVNDLRFERYRTQMDHIRLIPKFHVFFRDFEDDFRPTIFAGPGIGFLVRNEELAGGEITSEMRTVDLTGMVGVGFNYQMIPGFWLHVNTAFNYGFMDLNSRSTIVPDRLNTNNLSFNVGLAYSLNKAQNQLDK